MRTSFCFWRWSVKSRSLDFSVMSAVSRSSDFSNCALRSATWFSSKATIFGLSFSVRDGFGWVSFPFFDRFWRVSNPVFSCGHIRQAVVFRCVVCLLLGVKFGLIETSLIDDRIVVRKMAVSGQYPLTPQPPQSLLSGDRGQSESLLQGILQFYIPY